MSRGVATLYSQSLPLDTKRWNSFCDNLQNHYLSSLVADTLTYIIGKSCLVFILSLQTTARKAALMYPTAVVAYMIKKLVAVRMIHQPSQGEI